MSLFQAGAYQSKVLSYVVRQTRHWVERGNRALRKLKLAATWSAQILLYPAYVAFQSLRIAAVQVRQVWDLGVPAFRQALRSQAAPPPAEIVPTSDTSETPLRLALDAIRAFDLPTQLPVIWLPKVERLPADRLPDSPITRLSTSLPTIRLPTTRLPKSLVVRTIDAIGSLWNRASRLSQGLGKNQALGQRQSVSSQPQPPVYLQGIASCLTTRSLVLVTNQNEILDILTPQQQKHLRDRIIGGVADYYYGLKSQSRLPLLSRSWALVRASQPLWAVTRSRLQFLLSFLFALFHATRQVISQLQSPAQVLSPRPISKLPLPATEAIGLSLPWTADLLVQQALGLVQQFSLPASVQSRAQIRGIASQVDTRSLVLVSDQNQILDLLTAEQQVALRQRITWDAAHYGRYRQIRQSTRQAFARLHSGGSDRVFPAVRGLRGVMAWMQTSRVAIAANLFQEATLVLSPIGSLAAQLRPNSVSVMQWAGDRGSALAGPSIDSATWISSAATAVSSAMATPGVGTATRSLGGSGYIEIPATPLGYVETPIEAALRGLDRFLLWLEEMLILAWRWLRQQF